MFLLVFLSVYGAVNFYVLRRLFSLFSFKAKIWFYLLFICCTLSYLLAAVLERNFANTATKVFYLLAATWMGVAFLLFCCLLVFELVNLIFSPPKLIAGISILAVTLVLTVYSMINATRLGVVTVNLDAPIKMSIVQLSDIHLGSTSTAYLARIVATTNSLAPDVVLITGDLLDSHRPLTSAAVAPLKDLAAPAFLVTGNHEGYFGIEKAAELISTTKVRFLRNEVVDFQQVQIIGIDDSYDKDHVAKMIPKLAIDAAKFNILMYHRPKGLEAADRAGIDLMLAGHTHFGQIFPFNYFVRLSHRYMKGLYRQGGCTLFVSTGAGTWGPRMRLGSENQIVLIKLSPPE